MITSYWRSLRAIQDLAAMQCLVLLSAGVNNRMHIGGKLALSHLPLPYSGCIPTDLIRGHPFKTSTWREKGGSGGRDRGQVHVDIHTENYSPLTSFFSCKEVGIFYTRISPLYGI